MTTILVTGSKGQLGSELRELAAGYPHLQFTFTDVEELDITREDEVGRFFSGNRFDVVINCAAYTAVDQAEDDEGKVLLLNGTAPGILASACAKHNSFLVHLSTDYIFNSDGTRPIMEDDQPEPQSAYGRTKLEGELQVTARASHGMIIRTAWLYSSHGNNFVKTILKYARERGELNVVNDQRGTPTYARDLAKAILDILPLRTKIEGLGIFNYSNEGETTWYAFAVALLRMKGVSCKVNPVSTDAYPAKAKRPLYSVLSKEKIKTAFGIRIPDWEESLNACLQKID